MTTLVRTAEGTSIVDVSGEIDLSSSSAFRRLLFETLQGAERLAVNLAGARYIDSSGIATLIEVQKEARRTQKEMVLFALSAPARDVFALTHVTKVFRILETEAEALAP